MAEGGGGQSRFIIRAGAAKVTVRCANRDEEYTIYRPRGLAFCRHNTQHFRSSHTSIQEYLALDPDADEDKRREFRDDVDSLCIQAIEVLDDVLNVISSRLEDDRPPDLAREG